MLEQFAESVWAETDRLLSRVERLETQLTASYRTYALEGDRAYAGTQDSRAAAIVYSMAELESLTRFVLTEAHRAMNSLEVPVRDVRPCLRSLAAHGWFESLRSLQETAKVWERRALTTTMDYNAEPMKLPVVGRPKVQPPLDGKTPKPEHFVLVWTTYGLPDEPFTTGSWQTTLRKLSGIRNDLAHGNLPFSEVFQTAGLQEADVEGYLADLANFAIHFASSWVAYMSSASYLEQTPDNRVTTEA